jgi:hypothetical protein
MKIQSAGLFDRRGFLRIAAAGGGAAVVGSSAPLSRSDTAEKPLSPDAPAVTRSPHPTTSRYWMNTEGTFRDRFWIFCCPANTDFRSLQRRSVMTPAEGAYYLDVPNIIMVQASSTEAKYGRFELPFDQYALALRPLKRVAWSVVGSGGFTAPNETNEVLRLAKGTPNMSAIMLDDFFTGKSEGKRAILTVDELRDVRRQIETIGRKLDILVTYYYSRSLSVPLDDYLELVDVVTLWGGAADIPNLDANLEKVELRIPNKRIMLGCYMFDFGKKEPISVDLMRLQCEKGLQWLRQGRIEGMIFLANTVADFDFPSVEWTRQWIRRIGDEKL